MNLSRDLKINLLNLSLSTNQQISVLIPYQYETLQISVRRQESILNSNAYLE